MTAVAYATSSSISEPSLGANESCSLNYQQTAYLNSHAGVPNCPDNPAGGYGCPDSGYCPNQTDCVEQDGNRGDTTLAFRWIDVDGDQLVDLVASPAQGGLISYNFIQGDFGGLTGGPVEPTIFGDYPACPPAVTSFSANTYTMCGGMYPWFVYKNFGNGTFGVPRRGIGAAGRLPSSILYEPIPLETTQVDSSITSRAIGAGQANVDIDGDGYADAALGGGTPGWTIYRNDGTGQLKALGGSTPYDVSTESADAFNETFLFPGSSNPISVAGLVDLNGDGLVDHWAGSGVDRNIRNERWHLGRFR